MDLILYIVCLFVACWIPKVFKWIKFKNKYPILSAQLPSGILEVGDIVYFGEYKKTFRGVSTTDGHWYVFMPDNSVTPEFIEVSDAIARMDAIYGIYGIKWKKVS